MKETIHLYKGEKRKEFTLAILNLFKKEIKGRVLVKTNNVSYENYPTTTHPEVLDTVISFLKDNTYPLKTR